MKIIIDMRETSLYEKCTEICSANPTQMSQITIEKINLLIGDVFITTDEGRNISVIERKTIADLLSSITDGRYDEQSHRLLHSTGIHPHNIIYIIEGNLQTYRSFAERKKVYSAITSLNHFKGMSVIRTQNVSETAEFILAFASKVERNFLQKKQPKYLSNVYGHPNEERTVDTTTVTNPFLKPVAVAGATDVAGDKKVEEIVELPPTKEQYISTIKKSKKNNLTPSNIGVLILSQIPYVNSVTASVIMEKYNHSIQSLLKDLETNPQCLDGIYTEKDGKKRKLASNVVSNIRLFLCGGGGGDGGEKTTSIMPEKVE
jgi:ERCC4-type nuclease